MKDPLKNKDAKESSVMSLVFKIATTWWIYPVLLIEWAGNHPKITTALSYLAGVILYTELGTLFGYSFWPIFGIFIAILTWWFVASQVLCWYEELVCDNRVFYSQHSWFRWCMDFVDDEVVGPMEEYLQKTPNNPNFFFLIFIPCLGLPVYTLVLAIISALLTTILFLDWIRLLVIGFANLCLAITPK
jgi:hypothetical protein